MPQCAGVPELHTHTSLGRGGDDLTADGGIEPNPGPSPAKASASPGSTDRAYLNNWKLEALLADISSASNTPRRADDAPRKADALPASEMRLTDEAHPFAPFFSPLLPFSSPFSFGRGGDDLTVDRGVEPNPGPSSAECTCVGRAQRKQGRHKSSCPRSQVSTEQIITPVQPAQHVPSPSPLPSGVLESVLALRVGMLDRIPANAQLLVASALANVTQAAASGSPSAWLHLLLFPTLVLRKCQRGGAQAMTAEMRRRCSL